jgi:GTPase Era involved in 16S rRNA processing
MMDFVKDSLQDADVFLFIVDVTDKEEPNEFLVDKLIKIVLAHFPFPLPAIAFVVDDAIGTSNSFTKVFFETIVVSPTEIEPIKSDIF